MRSRNRNSLWLLFLIVAAILSSPAHGQDSTTTWKLVEERYSILEIAGARAGWNHEVIETDGQQFRTTTEQHFKISRGDLPIEIEMGSTFIETADGKPVSATVKQNTSRQVMETQYRFNDDHVEVIVNQGGRETKSQQPALAGEWLTPYAADRYGQKQRAGGAKELTLRTVELQYGLNVITRTSKLTGQEKYERNGETIDVALWTTTADIMPGIQTIERVNSNGESICEEVNMPGFGKMITRQVTKEEALGAAAGPAPELLLQTFVTPDKPIDNPMKATGAKLKLTVKNGEMPGLPTAGAQRVELSPDKKSAILTIDINDNVPASAADADNKHYCEASAMVDANDELIQKLAKRAAAREEDEQAAKDDPMRRAEALRRFVRRHISKKGMETAFASASETAKMKTGDCSEHGVLLAALLRADGIPSRVATGLVYADAFAGHESIFGWHMWTQALIDGKWVDFDATLPVRYNAAHILTATSSLNDGMGMADMASVLQLMGNLEVEVLDVQHEN
jgi:hypothetical protein